MLKTAPAIPSGSSGSKVNPSLAEHDILCPRKQCRSRSVGFWRSQLIRICTVCHQVCEFIATIQIKHSDWLKIRSGRGILIYSAWEGLTFQVLFSAFFQNCLLQNLLCLISVHGDVITFRKHAYSNNTENFTIKKWNRSDKKFWYVSYFCSKHRLWVLVRTALQRQF